MRLAELMAAAILVRLIECVMVLAPVVWPPAAAPLTAVFGYYVPEPVTCAAPICFIRLFELRLLTEVFVIDYWRLVSRLLAKVGYETNLY